MVSAKALDCSMKYMQHLNNTLVAKKLAAVINRILLQLFNVNIKQAVQLATFQSIHGTAQHQYRLNTLSVVIVSQLIITIALILYGIFGGLFGLFDDLSNRLITLVVLPSIVLLANIRALQHIKAGKTQIAGRIVVGISFGGVILAAYFSGGLYASAMLGLMVVLVMATVLLDFRAMFTLYTLTLSCFFLLLLAELMGIVPVVVEKDLPFRVIALIGAATSLFVLVSYHTYAIQQSERIIADYEAEAKRLETERTLTRNLAHDLRTPLSVLRTSNYLIQKKIEAGLPVDEYFPKMDRQLNRMNMMINAMIELTFLDSATALTTDEIVSLRETVNACVTALEDLAQKHHVTLQVTAETQTDVMVRGDHTQLKRAFEELIENSIQYGRDGGSVNISLRNDGEQAEVLITDDGIGISPQDHERIFERFYRVDQARTSQEGLGTGIGLSIVKKIIDLHGGTITVESELKKGSTFRVVIPTAPAESAAVMSQYKA